MALFITVENYLDAEVRLKKLDLVIKMTKKGQSILHRHSVRIGIPSGRYVSLVYELRIRRTESS